MRSSSNASRARFLEARTGIAAVVIAKHVDAN